MDCSISSSYKISNKYLNQQIQKKYKNRHSKKQRNSKTLYHRYRPKHKNNHSSFVSSQEQCHELQYKSCTILALNHYIKPKLNTQSSHKIAHNHYYSLQDLIPSKPSNIYAYASTSTKRQEANDNKLYTKKYMQSTNICKWMKLNCGTFFNSSFYIWNRDEDIHEMELMIREQNQNIDCIAYLIENTVQQMHCITISHDVSHVMSEYCRGYLIARCSNRQCFKEIKFFYEDRYNGVDTYFSLSHDFEANNIIYCCQCILNDQVYKMRQCECGNTDFSSEFTRYSCYKYKSDEKDIICIDEFKCDCIGHETRCSRHKGCNDCKRRVCTECEVLGWGFNQDGLCMNCANGLSTECSGCKHIFDADHKLEQCTLCRHDYCDGIKWKTLDILNRDELRDKYDAFLKRYTCGCNWKDKYFDSAHNLWYPVYSEWQRRIELAVVDECDIHDTLKCMICSTLFAICSTCEAARKSDMYICVTCVENNNAQCDVCDVEYIHCEMDTMISYGNRYKDMILDEFDERQCIECDVVCCVCSTCCDECNASYFGLYMCVACKNKNKKCCMYCHDSFINHALWDKICGTDTDIFCSFVENECCKRCGYDINNMCSKCFDIYGLQCIHCVKQGVCVQCNARITSNCTLCTLCFEQQYFITKEKNTFLSNIIDKKWKNNHCQKYRNKKLKKKQRKKKLNKDGKFTYNIGYNGNDIDFGVVKITSKWRKYKKMKKKLRY